MILGPGCSKSAEPFAKATPFYNLVQVSANHIRSSKILKFKIIHICNFQFSIGSKILDQSHYSLEQSISQIEIFAFSSLSVQFCETALVMLDSSFRYLLLCSKTTHFTGNEIAVIPELEITVNSSSTKDNQSLSQLAINVNLHQYFMLLQGGYGGSKPSSIMREDLFNVHAHHTTRAFSKPGKSGDRETFQMEKSGHTAREYGHLPRTFQRFGQKVEKGWDTVGQLSDFHRQR